MLERLPDSARTRLLVTLKPLVFPVHNFVERWYHTESRHRLAAIAGTTLWWRLLGEEKPGPGEPQTADEVISKVYQQASRHCEIRPEEHLGNVAIANGLVTRARQHFRTADSIPRGRP